MDYRMYIESDAQVLSGLISMKSSKEKRAAPPLVGTRF